MKARALFVAVVLAAVATPCYNDSDTNLTELRDNLDITYAIAGRFTIYPPEYYKRRIEIQTANLKKNPNDLNAYDNLAVAYDRIGKHDEAIATIRKERALLDKPGVNPLTEVKDELVPNAPPVNHRYTVEANEGTFLIHRWIALGGNSDMSDAIEAEKHIAKAIEINPNAHFGREFAQLYCMRAILKGAKEGDWKRNFTENLIAIADKDKVDHKALRRGIAGMMVLGNAWNSPVMLKAIAYLVPEDEQIVEFARVFVEREIDVIKQKALDSGRDYSAEQWVDLERPLSIYLNSRVSPLAHSVFFPKLEKNAKQFRANRKSWIEKKLKLGEHPDIHPDFWNGFKDVNAIPEGEYEKRSVPGRIGIPSVVLVPCSIATILGIGGLVIRDRIQKRRPW